MKTNKMTKEISLVLNFLTVFSCNLALAFGGGSLEGGGGKIVQFTDKNGQQQTKLLDIYEYQVQNRLQGKIIPQKFESMKAVEIVDAVLSDKSSRSQLSQVINFYTQMGDITFGDSSRNQDIDLIRYSWNLFKKGITDFDNQGYHNVGNLIILENEELVTTADSFELFFPRGSEIKQLAHYKGDDLYLDYHLYKNLDELNKAALWIHELIYKVLREGSREQNSIRTRRLVAELLFQKNKIRTMKDVLQNKEYFECYTDQADLESKLDTTEETYPSKVYVINNGTFSSNNPHVKTQQHIVEIIPDVIDGYYILDKHGFGNGSGTVMNFHRPQKLKGLGGGAKLDQIEKGTEFKFNFPQNNKNQLQINVEIKSINGFQSGMKTLTCHPEKVFNKK